MQENDVEKHKKDVIKLAATLPLAEVIECPDIIKADLISFIAILRREKMEIKGIAKDAGLGNITLEDVLEQLETVFRLAPLTIA